MIHFQSGCTRTTERAAYCGAAMEMSSNLSIAFYYYMLTIQNDILLVFNK